MSETEDFMWIAHYHDGSHLPEIDGQTEYGFADIDVTRLIAFELVPQRDGLPHPVVDLGQDERPIFFRRRTISLDPVTETEAGRSTITVIGWQRHIRLGRAQEFTFHSYSAYYTNGSVVHTSRQERIA